MSYGIIYKIRNKVNGMEYVGATIMPLEQRWARHCWSSTLKAGKMPITRAILQYGERQFEVHKICECDSIEEMDELELLYINKLNTWLPNGYNGMAGKRSVVVCNDVIMRSAKARRGRKFTEEQRKKMSDSHKGLPISDELRRKRSELRKGKKLSDSAYENAIKAVAKRYIVTSPDGEEFVVVNMAKFCRIYDLSPSKMCLVAQGKRDHHWGWRVRYGD